MKGRVILIDMPKERASQAALLVDGRLKDLLLDPPDGDTTPAPDEIYWAKVDRLVPKMGGAFVKLTPEHQGFLREAKGLREGDQLPTYVSVFAEPGKAIPVSRHLLFKSRWLILTPGRPGVNVSRSIRDPQERERLSKCVAEPEENCGIIVRTAARGIGEEMLWKVAKAAVLARFYGASLHRLSDATGLDFKGTKKLVNGLDKIYPEIPLFSKAIIKHVEKTGFLETFSGRRFKFDGEHSPYKDAANRLAQATVSQMIQKAMVKLDDKMPWAPLVLQVHDEIINEVPEDRVEEFCLRAEPIITHQPWSSVPFVTDKRVGQNWGEL